MAVADETVSLIIAEAGTERRRRVDLNLIGGPSVTDRAALDRIDLDFFGTVRVGVLEATFDHSDLGIGYPADRAIGTVPAGAHVLGTSIRIAEAFVGGGNTVGTVDIGPATDVDAIVDEADLLAAAVDFMCASAPDGIAPNRRFAAATVIWGHFVCDVGWDLFTAGRCTIRVLYVVPA